jgi:hypothetical protein
VGNGEILFHRALLWGWMSLNEAFGSDFPVGSALVTKS